MKRNTILIVEDEPVIADTLKIYLVNEGFDVEIIGDGNEAIQRVQALDPILVLLDLNLPGQDGIQVCEHIRSYSNVPIMMVTARDEEQDKLHGLRIGADDYITKPFSVREVVARVQALLRRVWHPNSERDRLMVNDLWMDKKSMRVWKQGKEVKVTPTEFKLLAVLMEHAGQVLSREQIIEKMHGHSYEGYERTLDSHIKHLRSKLQDSPQKSKYIETISGVGYRFKQS